MNDNRFSLGRAATPSVSSVLLANDSGNFYAANERDKEIPDLCMIWQRSKLFLILWNFPQQRQTITVILSSVIDLYACTLVKPYAGIYGN